ncbi:hypothetical protein F4703DRAFT_1894821 [Phycomyces blakesleeanus]
MPLKFSAFIGMNKHIIIQDIILHRRTSLVDVKRMWINRFASETKRENPAEMDSEKVDWSELMETAIEKSNEVIEQSIRRKRNLIISDTYEKENEIFGHTITKRQAEDSIVKGVKGKKAIRKLEDIVKLDNDFQKGNVDEKEEVPVVEAASSQEYHANDISQDSDLEFQADTGVPFMNIVYNESEIDSSYKDRPSLTEIEESSSPSTIGYVWTMTLGELNIISFGKKEMATTNKYIKTLYDDAHSDAMNKILKPGDVDKRLFLSGLFDCSISTEIIEQYLVPIAKLPNTINSCIKSMEKAMDNNTIMESGGTQYNSVEELALYHVILSIFLNHAVIPIKIQTSELDFIVKSVACLLGPIWSSNDQVKIIWDYTTAINKQKMPDTVSSRPDMVFHSNLYEIGNGEIKAVNTPKTAVNLARNRVLETCKRQLHQRLKKARSSKEAVTFGILIYGLSYEIYIVTFENGYYPYKRVSVGLMPTSNTTYKCTEKMLMDLIQLKRSMNRSLRIDDNTKDTQEFTLVDKNQLLPTLSYGMLSH